MTAAANEPTTVEPLTIVAPPRVVTGDAPGDRIPFTMTPCCPDGSECSHADIEATEDDPNAPTAERRNGILWAVRPKNALLMLLLGRIEVAKDGQYETTTLAYRTFTEACMDPTDGDLLWERLSDPTDQIDTDDMDALLRTFAERWSGRPFSQPSGSGALPRGTGRPSTGRSRSTGKTRSR